MAIRNASLLLASVALALLLACGVTLSVRTEPARAVFPGANGKIVFVERNDEESDYGIKLINPNGSGLTTLVENPQNPHGFNLLGAPAFSPDGTRVAYDSGRKNNSEVYKVNVANRTVTPITDNEFYDSSPTWHPEGTRIAFVRGEYIHSIENTDIFARRADGTGKAINLTNTPEEDEFDPAWSPDGKEIAFYSHTAHDVFVLNLQTGQRRNLTNDGVAFIERDPDWSPDGTRVVLWSYNIGVTPEIERIITVKASDGSDKRLLAQVRRSEDSSNSHFVGATYSPDGKQVAYVKVNLDNPNPNSRYGLFKMNASDGSNKQRIHAAYSVGFPDWGVRAQP
jgi:Tol biopolymer transport system component